ncbi:cytochrome c maturation protein CcmE domain-containing protein [Pelosinus propionicus]|uniref:Cytochrome c-type biogenesis protein CcmE n=1 Tax=Pelosinus propionicus DSM 13327 TaxID=1123291 RepID=A0A1I4PCY4_9FIRM|nr:cytochrome c maturation protein CcmE [Pelosinus propionicus]SFM25517.1 cytochrome c-type biogenesis protein CcmE [Pelosinus propionicus DSM 13327]
MKKRHGIGIGIIALFLVFSAISFKSSLTPYVTFAQAKTMNGSVQVRGILISERVVMTDDKKAIMFKLQDEKGQEALIVYKGTKPDGIEEATSIVAIGKYQNDQFIAEKLLVKCPSKYQSAQGSVNK